MRAVLCGLMGAVLAVSGAQSGALCRPGHIQLRQDVRAFSVNEASSFVSQDAERLALKGAVENQPFVIDLQSAKGSTGFLTSYPGRAADVGGMPVRWSRKPVRQIKSGSTIDVETGPLAGSWRISCNE